MPLCIRVDQSRTFLSQSLAEGCANTPQESHSPRYFSILSSLVGFRTHGRPTRLQQPVCLLPGSRRCGDGLRRPEPCLSPSHTYRASADRGAALKAASRASEGLRPELWDLTAAFLPPQPPRRTRLKRSPAECGCAKHELNRI